MLEPSRRRRPARTGPTRGRRRPHHWRGASCARTAGSTSCCGRRRRPCARTVATRPCCGRPPRAACAATARRRHRSGCAAAWLPCGLPTGWSSSRLGVRRRGGATVRRGGRSEGCLAAAGPRARVAALGGLCGARFFVKTKPAGARGPRRAVPARRTACVEGAARRSVRGALGGRCDDDGAGKMVSRRGRGGARGACARRRSGGAASRAASSGGRRPGDAGRRGCAEANHAPSANHGNVDLLPLGPPSPATQFLARRTLLAAQSRRRASPVVL